MDPPVVDIGEVVTIVGTGLPPNSQVQLTYYFVDAPGNGKEADFGLVATDDSGAFQHQLQIPTDWCSSRGQIYATTADVNRSGIAAFAVDAAC